MPDLIDGLLNNLEKFREDHTKLKEDYGKIKKLIDRMIIAIKSLRITNQLVTHLDMISALDEDIAKDINSLERLYRRLGQVANLKTGNVRVRTQTNEAIAKFLKSSREAQESIETAINGLAADTVAKVVVKLNQLYKDLAESSGIFQNGLKRTRELMKFIEEVGREFEAAQIAQQKIGEMIKRLLAYYEELKKKYVLIVNKSKKIKKDFRDLVNKELRYWEFCSPKLNVIVEMSKPEKNVNIAQQTKNKAKIKDNLTKIGSALTRAELRGRTAAKLVEKLNQLLPFLNQEQGNNLIRLVEQDKVFEGQFYMDKAKKLQPLLRQPMVNWQELHQQALVIQKDDQVVVAILVALKKKLA